MDALISRGVRGVLITRPNNSSLGENFSFGRILQFTIQMVSSKWSGHVFGNLSHVVVVHSSSPKFGAHNLARRYSMSWCLVPHFLHNSRTVSFLKCVPPLVM